VPVLSGQWLKIHPIFFPSNTSYSYSCFHIIGVKGKFLVPIVMLFCDGCHMLSGLILAHLVECISIP